MFKVEHLTYSDLFVFLQVDIHLLCSREQSSPQRGWVSEGAARRLFCFIFMNSKI